ncbi:MAG: hypothetical protein ACRBHB_08495 [Arenicella sp.]
MTLSTEQRSWMQQAPTDHATIQQLCIRPKSGLRQFPDKIELCTQRGVVGDRWLHHTWMHLEDGSPDPRLQVSILPYRTWQLVCKEKQESGLAIHPGDTVIADLNCSTHNLPVGQRLQLGSAIIEVSDVFNNACNKWRNRYGSDSIKWINQKINLPLRLRGVLCKIVHSGEFTMNDTINKVCYD